MAKTLRRKIDLDTAAATRKAQQLQQAVRGIGDASQSATNTGQRGFMGLEGAVTRLSGALGGAGLIAAIRGAEQQWVSSFAAMDRASQQAVERLKQTAVNIAGQPERELRDILDKGRGRRVSLGDITRRAVAAQQQYDLASRGDYVEAAKRIYSRTGNMAGGLMAPALTFANVAGAPGAVAGDVTALSQEMWGANTVQDVQRRLAQVRAVGQGSAYTAGQFAGIFSSTAALLKGAGLQAPEEQLGFASAFSKFFPNSPELAATAMQQMSTLPLRKTQWVSRMLRKAGRDPKSYNVNDIRFAISQYLREEAKKGPNAAGKALQTVAEESGMPIRSLRPLQMSKEEVWETQYKGALDTARGATWEGNIMESFREFTNTPEAARRRRVAGAILPDLADVQGGGLRWAADQLDAMRSQFRRGRPNYREDVLAYQQQWNRGMLQRGMRDADLTEEQAADMMAMDEIARGLEKELETIPGMFAGPKEQLTELLLAPTGAKMPQRLGDRLRQARLDATQPRSVFGDASTYMPVLNETAREALRVLRGRGSSNITVGNNVYQLNEKNTAQTKQDRTNQ